MIIVSEKIFRSGILMLMASLCTLSSAKEIDFNTTIPVEVRESSVFKKPDYAINAIDHYEKIALSPGAEALRKHLQDHYKVSHSETVQIVSSVFKYSDAHNMAPELVFSIIDNESGFKPRAQSSRGARGLMQVLPVYHQDKIRVDGGSNDLLWKTDFNIKIGTRIFQEYLNKSRGNVREALARYNGSYGTNSGYPEKILRIKDKYRTYTKDIRI